MEATLASIERKIGERKGREEKEGEKEGKKGKEGRGKREREEGKGKGWVSVLKEDKDGTCEGGRKRWRRSAAGWEAKICAYIHVLALSERRARALLGEEARGGCWGEVERGQG